MIDIEAQIMGFVSEQSPTEIDVISGAHGDQAAGEFFQGTLGLGGRNKKREPDQTEAGRAGLGQPIILNQNCLAPRVPEEASA
jgi:hypothetical protein